MNQKIIQITAGRGPAECCWVVAKVLKTVLEEARSIGLEYMILQKIPGNENRTVQSVTLTIAGDEVDPFLKSWIGTVQWIGTSEFRKHHKRKNWFIAINELENVQQEEISEKDIVFKTMRSSGPGGQHANKVSSAVRAIHVPTRTAVVVMDSRSQHQNKKIAICRLKEKMVDIALSKTKQAAQMQWEQHLEIERGNPIRVFKGVDFKNENKVQTFKKMRNQLKKDLRNRLNE
ncbi:peptide chain release factor H [Aquimarina sp. D1M17]|uniref:peptide chain release factor H n=1 Tax=Aquimarina acroporae TaxID=2937283 RepID=UPI0020C0329F|nr:peptide chain release factor H [Aquimarina acroporae]MCK8520160.1 peptide chain release factor H [Aquimarina acroporae]